jgi:hypothetical protein
VLPLSSGTLCPFKMKAILLFETSGTIHVTTQRRYMKALTHRIIAVSTYKSCRKLRLLEFSQALPVCPYYKCSGKVKMNILRGWSDGEGKVEVLEVSNLSNCHSSHHNSA